MIPANWTQILADIKPFGETDIGAVLRSAGSAMGFSAANLVHDGRSLGRSGGTGDLAGGQSYELPFSKAQLRVLFDSPPSTDSEEAMAALARVLDLALLVDDRRASESVAPLIDPMGAKDPLTKTIDRNAFSEFLDFEFASGPLHATVILVGLDNMDGVTSTLGHGVRDAVLSEVADRFRETLRTNDTISRIDSDVFAVFCPDMSVQLATTLARRLQGIVHIPIRVGENELQVSACVGVATRSRGERAPEIIAHGDAALQASRANGPGEFSIYDGEIVVKTEDRRELAAELIDAITNNELTTGRSPIVHLPAGKVVGIEAHVVWNHPKRGSIDDAAFLDLAELIGRVGDVERAVLEFALAGSGAGNGVRTGLNLSASTIRDSRAIGWIVDRLAQADSTVLFEIAEDAARAAGRGAAHNLQRLRDAGASIVLDDFGKTEGSLRTLHSLPLDGIKLHSSILDPSDPAKCESISKAVYASANELGLEVVHSGVDTDADLRLLLQMDAQISGRGFFAQGKAVQARVSSSRVA